MPWARRTKRAWGLSPRTRGNPGGRGDHAEGKGSIPANAGEPFARGECRGKTGVYPRERGGTVGSENPLARVEGLSPRTRGNPSGSRRRRPPPGSIPANAGEPFERRHRSLPLGVYPRERGGTPIGSAPCLGRQGLSPRTRGNRPDGGDAPGGFGSIPANAGEPKSESGGDRRARVYPRERGGTT